MGIRLPIPRHKVSRMILPCGLMLAGFTIFLCGLVRTFYIDQEMAEIQTEKYTAKIANEYMEWWIGLPLMACSIFAICAVHFDRPLLFKLSVLALGTLFVLLLFALLLDAGELSFLSRNVKHYRFLKKEGFECKSKFHEYEYKNHTYPHRECYCTKGQIIDMGFFILTTCEVLFALYYLYGVMSFALCCAVALTLFTLFSFVLILKRISQIITALHLDDKPLSEDLTNVHGDLHVEP